MKKTVIYRGFYITPQQGGGFEVSRIDPPSEGWSFRMGGIPSLRECKWYINGVVMAYNVSHCCAKDYVAL
jgi:hypothetical protein